MSAATAKYGILVGVDGSAQSNAAVAWAAREAVMRQLPITLLHIGPCGCRLAGGPAVREYD